MTAAPHTDQRPRREDSYPRPVTSQIRWLIALSMALAVVILFGSWAFLAERAKLDVRADHAAPAITGR
jgi:hypothetical protein